MLEMQRRAGGSGSGSCAALAHQSGSTSSSTRAAGGGAVASAAAKVKARQTAAAAALPSNWSKLGVIMLSMACLFSLVHFNVQVYDVRDSQQESKHATAIVIASSKENATDPVPPKEEGAASVADVAALLAANWSESLPAEQRGGGQGVAGAKDSSESQRRLSDEGARAASPSPEACRVWLVTAASSSHYVSMINLMVSAAANIACGHMVLWDIGLSDEQWDQMTAFLGGSNTHGRLGGLEVELRKFDLSQYPAHASLEERTYAWKVLAFNEVAKEASLAMGGGSSSKESCIVLWLDAGDVINKPLDTLFQLTRESGFVTVPSKGTLEGWTHPLALERLSVAQKHYELPMLNGAVLAFDIGNERTQELISRWVACAEDRGCIAPEGSSRANHRQDQSALSCLVYSMEFHLSWDTKKINALYIRPGRLGMKALGDTPSSPVRTISLHIDALGTREVGDHTEIILEADRFLDDVTRSGFDKALSHGSRTAQGCYCRFMFCFCYCRGPE